MAGTIFLKIPGIDGESKRKGYEKQIVCLSFSYGMSQLVDRHLAAGEVQFQDISLTKIADKASPLLYDALCQGNKFTKDVVLSVERAPGDKPTLYLQITLKDATLTSVSSSGSDGGGLAMESLTFRFGKILISYTDEDKNKTEFSWNVDEGKSQV